MPSNFDLKQHRFGAGRDLVRTFRNGMIVWGPRKQQHHIRPVVSANPTPAAETEDHGRMEVIREKRRLAPEHLDAVEHEQAHHRRRILHTLPGILSKRFHRG